MGSHTQGHLYCFLHGHMCEVLAGMLDPKGSHKIPLPMCVAATCTGYKPNGVFLDDPKGLFILRWYKEVDKEGKELSGYQNAKCAAYVLTLDNDGAPFRWTPNVQLITKVYLRNSRAPMP